ncbi:uncharacterized protein LOC107216614 [Neodiprion lecontei]|uniref:Uncharacterized protein LOC107216614 n=1 Tax=Neodiprion lecontei TaxID=441921 RepID=A0A6J0B5A3_NEOLC|nr:uncharacterized protein LOC107216614 [Neodiprion lecontei]
MGGDFNARVGSQGSVHEDALLGSSLHSTRSSLDTTHTARGSQLINFGDINGLILLNGRTPSDYPAQHTFCSSSGKSVIDLVWVDLAGANLIDDLQTMSEATTSDHFPVVATLNFLIKTPTSPYSSDSFSSSVKLRWNSPVQDSYTNAMLLSQHLGISFETSTTDSLHTNLVSAIIEASKEAGMLTQNTQNTVQLITHKPWFDKDCRDAKKKLHQTLRLARAAKFNLSETEEYLNQKKRYKELISTKLNSYRLTVVQRFADISNTTQFWRTYNSFKKHSHSPSLPLATWSEFYKNVFPPRIIDNTTYFGVSDPILDTSITYDEIRRSINGMKNGKAPGPDAITGEFIKNLPSNWLLYIQSMFNKILDTVHIPSDWAQVAMFMLFKKGDQSDPGNYRGLAMINVLTKVFTTILKNRLIKWIDLTGALPEEQAGFTAKKGCIDNIFSLLAALQIGLRNKKSRLYGLFVDFRRAFDSVPHSALWRKLFLLGVSPKMIRILKCLYDQAELRVRSEGRLSGAFEVTEGVLQGEILSPILFILYLHDIVDFFRSKGAQGIQINNVYDLIMLLYADDLVILARTFSTLRKSLSILEEYCACNKLTVNMDKTKIIHFRKGGPRERRSLFYNGQPIEWAVEYVYLGVPFTSSTLGLSAAKSASQKVHSAAGAALSTLASIKAESWHGITKIYEAIVASTLLYASHIWGLHYLDTLEKSQLSFYKRLLLFPSGTPSAPLKHELNSSYVKTGVLRLALGWIARILEMDEHRIPKICFSRLVILANSLSTDPSYNWILQIKQLAGTRSLDLAAITEKTPCQVAIPRHLNSPIASYLKENPVHMARVLAQARLANNHYFSFSFKRMYYGINPQLLCSICNLQENENLAHIFLRCPVYRPYREHFIAPLYPTHATDDVSLVLNILNDLRPVTVKAVYLFLARSMKLRAFCLND